MDDVVADALLLLVAWSKENGHPSDEKARSCLGAAWTGEKRAHERRPTIRAEFDELANRTSDEAPAFARPKKTSKRTEPTRGARTKRRKRLLELTEAAALEILAKRQRELSEGGFRFSGVKRIKNKKPEPRTRRFVDGDTGNVVEHHTTGKQGLERLAEEIADGVAALRKRGERYTRPSPRDPRPALERLVTAPELAWMTATEIAALAVLVGAVEVPEATTGRGAIRKVMDRIRQRIPS